MKAVRKVIVGLLVHYQTKNNKSSLLEYNKEFCILLEANKFFSAEEVREAPK